MKKTLNDVYKDACKELARDMSRQLTSNAVNDGWNVQVATGLDVKYDSGVFETTHNPEHATQVFDAEYGDQNQLGKATIRKMYSSKKELLDRFAHILEKELMK